MFSCSGCKYSSVVKQHLTRHINKNNKCGTNLHIIENNIEIKCEYCNKLYKTQPSLKRHHKTCKILKTNYIYKLKENEQKIKELEMQLSQKPTTINNINNNITINVQVNGYNNTDFSKLTNRQFSKALNKTLMSIPQLIEFSHFNPKFPENHNIYISNQKGKYAMIYNGENWEIKDQSSTIDKLINDQEYELEQWVHVIGEKHPTAMEKFNRYLEVKEKDGALDAMKEEVKLLLYNKRNIIKN